MKRPPVLNSSGLGIKQRQQKTTASAGTFVKHFLCASSCAQSDRDWFVEPFLSRCEDQGQAPSLPAPPLWLNCQRKGIVGDVWFWQGQSPDEDPSFCSGMESERLRLNRNAGSGLVNDCRQKPKRLPHAQEGGVASEQQLTESAWPRHRDFR